MMDLPQGYLQPQSQSSNGSIPCDHVIKLGCLPTRPYLQAICSISQSFDHILQRFAENQQLFHVSGKSMAIANHGFAYVSSHLMFMVVLHYSAVSDCHELWGGGMKGKMLWEMKINAVSPCDAASRSPSWKKEGANYQSEPGLSLVTLAWAMRNR